MKSCIVGARNVAIGGLYRGIAKPIFFMQDPEDVHDRTIRLGRMLGSNPLTRGITRLSLGYSHPMLRQKIAGIHFMNPIGLAAGFDKNARLTGIMGAVGFGHEEIGTITGEPCAGNPKPRLWRLPKSKGLVIYYGLMNDGCEAIAKRLKGKRFSLPVGVSVGKTNCKATADMKTGIEDYAKAYRVLSGIGSYDTINISCPNAWGGQPFTWASHLRKLMERLDEHRNKKPMFLKMSPDLNRHEMNGIFKVAKKHEVTGLIFSNLTHNRNNIIDKNVPSQGSVSGQPIRNLSTEQLRYARQKTGDGFVLIGCGGVFTAEHAYEKIQAGASMLQMVTGLIFEGPQVVSEINRGLVKLLKRDGHKNISKAVGSSNL